MALASSGLSPPLHHSCAVHKLYGPVTLLPTDLKNISHSIPQLSSGARPCLPHTPHPVTERVEASNTPRTLFHHVGLNKTDSGHCFFERSFLLFKVVVLESQEHSAGSP